MSYLIFAWLASILYGSVVVITKLTSKYSIENPFLFNFFYAGSILLWTIPLTLLNHAGIPTHWLPIILTGFFYALSGLLYITAIYKLDISTISPLYNLQIAFAVVLAGIILHEKLFLWQYLLVGIIFLAGLFTTIDEKMKIQSFFKWTVFIAILGALSYAFSDITTNKAVAQNNYWTVTLWVPIVSQCILLLTTPFFRKDLKTLSLNPLLAILIIGACDALGTFAAIKAYASNVAVSVVIVSLPISLLLAITLSAFLPHLLEKHTLKVYAIRVIAAIIMVAAAIKLSLG